MDLASPSGGTVRVSQGLYETLRRSTTGGISVPHVIERIVRGNGVEGDRILLELVAVLADLLRTGAAYLETVDPSLAPERVMAERLATV